MDQGKLIVFETKVPQRQTPDQKNEWNNFWNRSYVQRFLDLTRKYESEFYKRAVISPYFDRKHTFLEVGCGTGILLVTLSRYFKKVVALDYSPVSLKIARRVFKRSRVSNYKLILGDIRGRFDPATKYDVVFSNGLVEHFIDPSAAIKRHLSYVKSGGVSIILAPSAYGFKHLFFKMTDNKLLKRLWPWTEQYFFTKESMTKEIEKISSSQILWREISILRRVENIVVIIKKK